MTKTRNKRRWLLALALTVAAGLAGVSWWEHTHQAPPQVITLSNGEQFRFAGTTYGTRNVPPSSLAQVVSWLPGPLAKLAKQRVGTRISQANDGGKYESPQLFVWFQRLGTNSPGPGHGTLIAMLSNEAGVQAGMGIWYPAFDNRMVWSYVAFPVFPRRSRALQLTLYQPSLTGAPPKSSGLNRAPPKSVGMVTIPNPFYRHYGQWKAEPIPAVKKAGDLQVRLDGLAIGNLNSAAVSPIKLTDYEPANKGERTFTAFDWSVVSPPGDGATWVLHAAELSDATGNVLRHGLQWAWSSAIMSRQQGSDSGIRKTEPAFAGFAPPFQGTLWPDEAAWRLKLVLKRRNGIAPVELAIFKNVPVPAMVTTNRMFLSQNVGGIQIALTEFARQPNRIRNTGFVSGGLVFFSEPSRIKVELPAKTAGVAVDLLEMTADVGSPEAGNRDQVDFSYVLELPFIPTNAQTMDITFAVQKTRSVEFLVAPPKAK